MVLLDRSTEKVCLVYHSNVNHEEACSVGDCEFRASFLKRHNECGGSVSVVPRFGVSIAVQYAPAMVRSIDPKQRDIAVHAATIP